MNLPLVSSFSSYCYTTILALTITVAGIISGSYLILNDHFFDETLFNIFITAFVAIGFGILCYLVMKYLPENR